MALDGTHSSPHRTQIRLIALETAARGPVQPDDCLRTIKARFGTVAQGLPGVDALREELARSFQELTMATLVGPDSQGRFAITPRGIALLRTHPKGIGRTVLERYTEYRDYIAAVSSTRRMHPR